MAARHSPHIAATQLPGTKAQRQPVPRLTGAAAGVQTAILVGFAISAVTIASIPAQAQSVTQASGPATYALSIPAGPLSQALSQFATSTGVELTANAAMLSGKQSGGLSGSYTVQAGFAALLNGHGLQATRQANGSYTIELAAQIGTAVLPTVLVSSYGLNDGTTEGSNSYTTTGPSGTATKLGLSLRETPQSISVVTRQRMDDQNLNSVAAVLEQTPGISVQNLGSERYTVYSRGYSIDSYQYDGIPTNLLITSQMSSQSLGDTIMYDRVEVLRGATGLVTGAGDPSGTINLVRKRPPPEFQASVGLTAGSWDLYRAEADIGGPLNEAGTLRGRLVAAHQRSNSYIDYYKQDKTLVYGVLQADVTDSTRITAGIDYQINDPKGAFSSAGFPLWYSDGTQTDFSRSFSPAAKWSTNKQETLNTFATIEQRLPNDWELKVSANYMRIDRDYSAAAAAWGFPDPVTGEGVRLYGGAGDTQQRQTGIDAQLKGPFQLFGRQHELVLGFSTSEFKNYHHPKYGAGIEGRYVNIFDWGNDTAEPITTNGKLYNGDTTIRQTGGYAALRFKPSDDLSLILGARLSNYKYRYDLEYIPASYGTRLNKLTEYHDNDVITPYAGIVYDLNDQHSVYASYTSIFMPQSYQDRTGNTLKPRTGDNYEIGLKSEFFDGSLNTALALFEIKQDNLAEIDEGHTVPGTTTSAYRAVQGAKSRGIEFEISGEVLPRWNVAASFSHSITRDASGNRLATTAPANLFKFWTTYRLPGEWHKWTIGGGVTGQSSMYLTASPSAIGKTVTARQSSVAIVNLMARYDFNEQLSATLNIGNLFDKKYLSAIESTFYSGYYGAPLNASLNVKYRF